MIYTNVEELGGNFDPVVTGNLDLCDNVVIASGYVSLDVIERYAPKLENIARKGGKAKLLVGMAFYEGLPQKKLDRLRKLSKNLSTLSSESGVYIPYKRKYHGKIYRFNVDNRIKHFLGSSNFSSTGLKGNMEATALISDAQTTSLIDKYIEFLLSEDQSATIDLLDIIVPGSSSYKRRLSAQSLDQLKKFNPEQIDLSDLEYFDVDLSRYTDKMKSSLNVYFGEGRFNRSTGKITPRDWYEAALIITADTIRNPLYPRGNFEAFTDDGYIIPMKTSGSNYKNLQSQGSLRLFGMWLKSKLQVTGALVALTPISLDTLEIYGRSSIRFYKISENKYFMDFSVNENAKLSL